MGRRWRPRSVRPHKIHRAAHELRARVVLRLAAIEHAAVQRERHREHRLAQRIYVRRPCRARHRAQRRQTPARFRRQRRQAHAVFHFETAAFRVTRRVQARFAGVQTPPHEPIPHTRPPKGLGVRRARGTNHQIARLQSAAGAFKTKSAPPSQQEA
jgi:hypothetical protein